MLQGTYGFYAQRRARGNPFPSYVTRVCDSGRWDSGSLQCAFAMYILYSLALAALLAVTTPWWALNMLRHGKYRAGLGERFGNVPARLHGENPRGCIWVHAVSVGEVLAVSGLIKELRQRFPGRRVFVSTTTATGQKLARERFGEGNVFYFPLDFAFAIRPYLRALRPALVIIAETEFWPNFLQLANGAGAAVAVVNARISDRSFPRYWQFRAVMRRILRRVNLFMAQTEEDAQRLLDVGAAPERVQVSGNLKFDIKPPSEPEIVRMLRTRTEAAGPIIVAGSTVEGEEPLVLQAFQQVLSNYPNAVLLLAPRHPERFGAVTELLSGSNLKFWLRSQWDGRAAIAGGVFLLDSIGELGAAYALADLAFVGGSLAPRGGHNILEPALFGVATLVGPHTENFRDIIERFRRADGVRVVGDGGELATAFLDLLANEAERRALGHRAAAVVRQHSGATARTVAELEKLLTVPVRMHGKEPAR